MTQNRFDKNFAHWLKKCGYKFVFKSTCPVCRQFIEMFPNKSDIPIHTGKRQKGTVPQIYYKGELFQPSSSIKFITRLYNELYRNTYEGGSCNSGRHKQIASSSFGASRRVAPSFPEGMSYDYQKTFGSLVPLPAFAKYDDTLHANRGGNALKCAENQHLYARNMPPDFPLPRRNSRRQQFGKAANNRLLPGVSEGYYTHRGATGLKRLPRSIYRPQKGVVPVYNRSPYGGARVGSALPRPYGPRDNALIKGYPAMPPPKAAPKKQKRMTKKQQREAFGPYVNQAYRYGSAATRRRYGPYVNQAYKFGSEFRPHYTRNWKPSYQTYGNKDLYLPDWNPYVTPGNRAAVNKRRGIQQRARRVSRKYANQAGFGGPRSSYDMMGYNDVAYENPYLMYPAGSNTYNFLTKMNYLPPCRDDPRWLKVQKHNNPTGFLSSSDVLPVSGYQRPKRGKSKFGRSDGFKMSNDGPWVSRGEQLGRPLTTQLVGTGDDAASAGYYAMAQPLKLYTYQNTDYASYNYPEFLDYRAWMGGFGKKTPTKTTKAKQTKSRQRKTTTKAKGRSRSRKTSGNTFRVSKNGRIRRV
jgi:hypothetical protein